MKITRQDLKAHLVGPYDVQQSALDRPGHVRGVPAHIKMPAGLQQLPHQLPALSQSVLNIYLLGLHRRTEHAIFRPSPSDSL